MFIGFASCLEEVYVIIIDVSVIQWGNNNWCRVYSILSILVVYARIVSSYQTTPLYLIGIADSALNMLLLKYVI